MRTFTVVMSLALPALGLMGCTIGDKAVEVRHSGGITVTKTCWALGIRDIKLCNIDLEIQ